MFFSEWRAKRKFKYLGFCDGYFRKGAVWGLPACISHESVHFFENGYGKRKIEGDYNMTKKPEVTAWLNGADMAQVLKENLQGTAA